jgi:NNP family nitrate/nitrite transporter-like MFS transporter
MDFRSVPMRTFHLTWFTFFLCFFAWFGIASLMPVVREDLGLTQSQVGNLVIGSVSVTVFSRIFFGWLCDRVGPRLSYSILLLTGSLPVMGIGLSDSYEMFMVFRLAIGVVGASFVITQYHTSAMFASNVVGTANATAAGWGNMGGGATLIIMPLIFAAFAGAGYLPAEAWRLSMLVPGGALFLMAFVYYFFTQDRVEDDGGTLRPTAPGNNQIRNLLTACRDYRVWALFLSYAACFGIEITVDNVATLYFVDTFDMGLMEAGLIAGSFGLMNLFARSLGGIVSDRVSNKFGLKGRVTVLGILLFLEGAGIMFFSSMDTLTWCIASMLVFAMFLKMANGATYAVVPFINRGSMGLVAGIVGAGGNLGAVLAGFLFASETVSYQQGFFIIGGVVSLVALFSFMIIVSRKTRDEELPLKPATLPG